MLLGNLPRDPRAVIAWNSLSTSSDHTCSRCCTAWDLGNIPMICAAFNRAFPRIGHVFD